MLLSSLFPHFSSPNSLLSAPQLYDLLKLQRNHYVTVLPYILLPWERGGHLSRNKCLHLFCSGQGWADDSQALVRLCHVAVCPKSPSSVQLEPSAPFRAEGSLDSLYWFTQLEKDIHKMDTPWEFWKKNWFTLFYCVEWNNSLLYNQVLDFILQHVASITLESKIWLCCQTWQKQVFYSHWIKFPFWSHPFVCQ